MYLCMYTVTYEEIHSPLLSGCNFSFFTTLEFRTEQISFFALVGTYSIAPSSWIDQENRTNDIISVVSVLVSVYQVVYFSV